MTDLKARQ